MAIYYGYARISSEGQSRYSIEDQHDYLKQRAIIKGLPFAFRPEVASGTSQAGRSVLSTLLAEVQPGDYIGVAYQDRFGRGGAEDIILLQDLYKQGVNVELRGKSFDPTDPLSAFSDEMILVVSKFYSKLQGQKAKQGIKNAQSSGRFLFRGSLFGYRRLDVEGVPKIEIDEGEARTIKRIIELYKLGNSYPKVADRIYDEGHRGRTGKRLSWSFIRKVMMNPVYMGYIIAEPIVFKSDPRFRSAAVNRNNLSPDQLIRSHYYPPIVTTEDWWKTYSSRRLVESKYETYKLYQRRPNEITGLLQCGYCAQRGSKVAYIHAIHQTRSRGKLTSHYPIYTSRLHIKGCPVEPKSYKVEVLEGLFRSLLVLAFERPDESKGYVVAELKKRRKQDEDVAAEIKQLREAKKANNLRLERIREAIALSTDSVQDLVDLRNDFLKRNGQIDRMIETLMTPPSLRRDELEALLRRFSLDTLKEFFDSTTEGSRRKVLYMELIESAVQHENSIFVRFRNGKTFDIGVHRALGKQYQTDFMAKVGFNGIDQGIVLIQYDKGSGMIDASGLTEDGRLGAHLPFVKSAMSGDFGTIQQMWDHFSAATDDEKMSRQINIETLIENNDLVRD